MAPKTEVERATRLLAALHDELKDYETPDAQRWLREVNQLQRFSAKSRTIIGIVGATGAGKSALINALLDEEKILPTSCMRACTAVVTEISHNNSDIPYRAEIEFIRKEEWNKELEALMGDLVTSKGKISRDSASEDTEAGLAFAKIRAVYPDLTKEQIAEATIDELMSHESVSCLSTVKHIECDDPSTFHKKLQIYVDSKEKVDLRHKSAKALPVMEFWPLIKVVRLYVKSRILETGAVLVDLPGVHDSNAARAAVSENYLKNCSGLLIAAPINRAVDDKSAKSLLGQSFKRQLKLDGSFGNLTWVCTKTDDISAQEAQDSLGLDDTVSAHQKRLEDLRDSQAQLHDKHSTLTATNLTAHRTCQDIDDEIHSFLSLLKRVPHGSRVDNSGAPHSLGKRKRTPEIVNGQNNSEISTFFQACKRSTKPQEAKVYEEIIDDSDGETDSRNQDALLQKFTDLKKRKATVLAQREQFAQQIAIIQQQAKDQKQEIAELRAKQTKICIAARNAYSRRAIQEDFAAGIREIDCELAEEEDPDNFDPAEDLRDYDEVAQCLPVFCVSSRAYQKLCGRLKKERKAWGFENAEDTEIPQLQNHCRSIAEVLHLAAIKGYLLKLELLSNSMKIWTSNQGQQESLTDIEQQNMEESLKADVDNFCKVLFGSSKGLIDATIHEIDTHICGNFANAVKKAQDKSAETVSAWGKPIDRDDRANGGIYHSTYLAITRRYGLFAKKNIVYDFNKELTDPLVNCLVHGWEKVFVHLAPPMFLKASAECEAAAQIFHAKVVATVKSCGVTAGSLDALEHQLSVHVRHAKQAFNRAKDAIRIGQKEVNRGFASQIAADMAPVYAKCAADSGLGVFARVKRTMQLGVHQSAEESMFHACTGFIENELHDMIKGVATQLQCQIEEIASWIERDYMQLAIDRGRKVAEDELLLKLSVANHIKEHEKQPVESEGPSDNRTLTPEPEIKIENRTEDPRFIELSAPLNLQVPTSQADLDEGPHDFVDSLNDFQSLFVDSDSEAEDIPHH